MKNYPLDVNQCPHQTTQYKFTMHYVKSDDKRRGGQLEDLAQKMQELNLNTTENYQLNSPCVCVSPLISLYGQGNKQCIYTFTPAF
jgi:hypothetical protein